jgi:hypothetical protein
MFSLLECAPFFFTLTAGSFNSAPIGAISFLFFAASFIGQGVNVEGVCTYLFTADLSHVAITGWQNMMPNSSSC